MYVMALPHASESWRWMLSNLWWSKQAKLIDSQFWKLEKTKPNTLQKTRWLPSRKPSHSIGFLEHIPIKRPCIRTDVGCFHIQNVSDRNFIVIQLRDTNFVGKTAFVGSSFIIFYFARIKNFLVQKKQKKKHSTNSELFSLHAKWLIRVRLNSNSAHEIHIFWLYQGDKKIRYAFVCEHILTR